MTAYGDKTLYNLEVQLQAKEAYKKNYVSEQSLAAIVQQHPVDLYQPNVAVRLGMSFLTIFIILAAIGLIILIISASSLIGTFMVLSGIGCYGAAEMMAGKKRHYNSGVDNTLLVAVPVLIVTGLGFDLNNAETFLSFLSFITCTWLAIRFADSLMTILATTSFLLFGFYAYVNLGEFTISTYPFVIISLAAAVFRVSSKMLQSPKRLIYHHCFNVMRLVGVIALYLGGNFYFIDNLTNDTYLLQADSPLRMSWLFWIWTMLFPVACFAKGIKSKDILLVRCGVLFICAAVLTFRNYYAIVPAEIAMLIAGALLIGITYWLMKYLQQPKHGFVFAEEDSEVKESANLEALLVGEAFSHQQPAAAEDPRFGGGSFGGAGAGSNY
jgi:hypothetical protein